jgi:hypothetical protein
MRRNAKFLVALFAVALSWSQETAGISGKVTNSVTGAPILRAHVHVGDSRDARKSFGALTNADGEFSITGIPPGSYFAGAERVGYVDSQRTPLTLQAGDRNSPLVLKLTPTGAISGRVLDADGEPMMVANVAAVGTGGSGSATTDHNGQYRIGGLSPGRYLVRASIQHRNLPPEIRTDGSKPVHYRLTEYPTQVTVPPGNETSGIDISLATGPIVKVSGRVLDAPAGAREVLVAAIDVTGSEEESEIELGYRAKGDGYFTLWGFDPGTYTIRAAEMSGGQMQSAPVDLEVGTADVDRIELRFVPPFGIAGRVQMAEDGDPPSPGQIRGHVSLRPLADSGSAVQGSIGEDGSFQLDKVQADRYHVELNSAIGYVKSMSLGTVDIDGDVLDLRNGAGDGVLTLKVSTATAEISGTVQDTKGQMFVSLAPEYGQQRQGLFTETGEYRFQNVRPGKYFLLAGDASIGRVDFSPGVLELLGDKVVTLEVHAGDKITQDLKPVIP